MDVTSSVLTVLMSAVVMGQAANVLATTQGQSQTQAAAAAPAAAQGADQTTATYGDWLLRCAQNDPNKPGRTCEVVQTVMIQGQTAPFAQLAFGRLAPTEPLYFTAVLPTNITFPSMLRVAIDEKDPKPVDVAWTRCLPGGCFASLAMSDEVLTRWRAQAEGGRISFKNGAGQDTTVAISFRGLARALDALAKERSNPHQYASRI